VQEGHIVGNHTMNHPDMSKVPSREAFGKELQAVEALYEDITGQTMPKFYRPPQGLYSGENLEMAKELGYKTVFWSLAYADWDNDHQPNPDEAVEKLIRRTHDGAVILLHATSKTNAQILDRLLTRWKDMGYRFAPLTELFA
jgi:peptidoglycan-N-acetylmuramic acid deacetylase